MIQNIKDRVPINVLSNAAIRYGIYDEFGKLVRYEYIKREDEPAEEGTPINRALFSNLQGDLYTADRYNKVEMNFGELDELLPVAGDIMPSAWIKVSDTEYVADDGTVLTVSGVYSATSNLPTAMFDKDDTSYFRSNSADNSFVKLKFAEPKKITKMKTYIAGGSASSLTNFKIEGSNDYETWNVLYSQDSRQAELTEITLQNVDFYQYYRIYCTHTNYAHIREWQTSEYYGKKGYTCKLELPLTSYEIGKIVNIEGSSYESTEEEMEITSFENPYLDINNLGTKRIKGTIEAGEKYSLVYNGESWDIEGVQVVTGKFTGTTSLQTIDLSFEPKLVIVYSGSHNNMYKIAGTSENALQSQVPRILTKAYKYSNDGSIVSNGFTYRDYNTDATLHHYIAFR